MFIFLHFYYRCFHSFFPLFFVLPFTSFFGLFFVLFLILIAPPLFSSTVQLSRTLIRFASIEELIALFGN